MFGSIRARTARSSSPSIEFPDMSISRIVESCVTAAFRSTSNADFLPKRSIYCLKEASRSNPSNFSL